MLTWALKYLSQGLSVIPLVPRGKEPLIDWKPYQTRPPSESAVREWFNKWPQANIGVLTGTVSDIVVIDLDGADGIKSGQSLQLASPVTVTTGKGKHLWYRHPGEAVGNSVRSFPGVDVRGDGGYVLAPPSIHPNGLRYRWLKPLNLESLPLFSLSLINATEVVANKIVKEESWIAKSLEEMTNGNIDSTLFTICSRLRADGYSAEDARLFLSHHAMAAGATPGHLDDKIQNVWARYEPRKGVSVAVDYDRQSPSKSDVGSLIIHSPTNPDSWKQYSDMASSQSTNGASKLETGYPKLDSMLKGGLKSSRLFTVAARTGVGKTNWLISVSRSLCEAGFKVLLFSTEMPYSQIWERYLASLPDREQFKRHQFFVCDSFAPNIERVEEAIKEIKPDVFMFDHINHVSEEQRELGSFMQGLNFLRRKYECAGIVTAQLNRQADWVDLKTGEKITPRMSMIKGSGTIEQASSRVLLLSETRITNECTEIVGNLDKNDNGPKGLLHFGLFSNPYVMKEL